MNAVRRFRLRAGLSQAELASRVGRTQSFISQLESGRIKRPAYDSVLPLARELGCDPERLFPTKVSRAR
jgi:transcriptional regulator with XRE-family HTH domain